MTKFWSKFVISQLFLIGVTINCVSAVTKHDVSPLTVASILGASVWYAGLVVQLPVTGGFSGLSKLAVTLTVIGAMLMMTTAICRLTGVSRLLPLVTISLACLMTLPILFGAILVFALLRRKLSAGNS